MSLSTLKGKRFEHEAAFQLRKIFPDCRPASFIGERWLDRIKVDLSGTGQFQFQCKYVESNVPYSKILDTMPQNGHTNVILHKKGEGETLAVMRFEDLVSLIKKVER